MINDKKIFGMKKEREGIEKIARSKKIDLEKVKTELIKSLGERHKDRTAVMEFIGDPSIFTQLLKILPDFFSNNYIIAKPKIDKKYHNNFFYTTKLHIIKQSENYDSKIKNISYDEEGLLIDKIIPTCNVLLIPERGLTYSSDAPYPLIIGEKNGDSFQIKYSSSRTAYHKMNKYNPPITCKSGDVLTEDQIYSILHSNNTPFMALTNETINGFHILGNDDTTIEKLVQ